jgi:hypothetical protein
MDTDRRPYTERWQDREYLQQVKGFANNGIFISEVVQTLIEAREAADKAKTPEELAGCQAGIAAIKRLLTAPARAAILLKQQSDIERETGNEFSLK